MYSKLSSKLRFQANEVAICQSIFLEIHNLGNSPPPFHNVQERHLAGIRYQYAFLVVNGAIISQTLLLRNECVMVAALLNPVTWLFYMINALFSSGIALFVVGWNSKAKLHVSLTDAECCIGFGRDLLHVVFTAETRPPWVFLETQLICRELLRPLFEREIFGKESCLTSAKKISLSFRSRSSH